VGRVVTGPAAQAEFGESLSWPAILGSGWRLAHDQPAAWVAEESDRTLGGHRRSPERSSDHDIEGPIQIGSACQLLCSPEFDRGPFCGSQQLHRSLQELTTSLVAVEQDETGRRKGGEEHQPRKPTTAPQIQYCSRSVRQSREEGSSVLDLGLDPAGPEEAEFTALGKEFQEEIVGSRHHSHCSTWNATSAGSGLVGGVVGSVSGRTGCSTWNATSAGLHLSGRCHQPRV